MAAQVLLKLKVHCTRNSGSVFNQDQHVSEFQKETVGLGEAALG